MKTASPSAVPQDTSELDSYSWQRAALQAQAVLRDWAQGINLPLETKPESGPPLIEWYLAHKPETDEDLWDLLHHGLGLRLCKESRCLDHQSPFQFIADVFFERTSRAIGFANRAGGKTFNLALLSALFAVFKPGCSVTSAGATREQAGRCYEEFKQFMSGAFSAIPGEFLASHSRLLNQSTVKIITSTEKGLRSPHPNKFWLDEVELVSWSLLQTARSMTQSSPGIRATDVFTSTRQSDIGTMQRLLDEADKFTWNVYRWCIFEACERCSFECTKLNAPVVKGRTDGFAAEMADVPRDASGLCWAHARCQGRVRQSDGHYPLGDFISKATTLDDDTWAWEWACTTWANPLGVYSHELDAATHAMNWERFLALYQLPQIPREWRWFSAIDFGASPGHPFVFLQCFITPWDELHVFHEYRSTGERVLSDHAEAIKQAPRWAMGETCFADHDRQDRLELQRCGVYTQAADKEVLLGIARVRQRLRVHPSTGRPRLYFWTDACPETWKEMKAYQWPDRGDGQAGKEGGPVKSNDHGPDCVRYLANSVERGRPLMPSDIDAPPARMDVAAGKHWVDRTASKTTRDGPILDEDEDDRPFGDSEMARARW